MQTASALPDFSILVESVVAANLGGTLSGPGPFTVFAPTNAAFASLLTELGISKAALLANTALLSKVLTYHVVPGVVLKAEVPVGAPITTVEGKPSRSVPHSPSPSSALGFPTSPQPTCSPAMARFT